MGEEVARASEAAALALADVSASVAALAAPTGSRLVAGSALRAKAR